MPNTREEQKMDVEIREAFTSINTKLDAIRADASDDRERIARMEERAKSAHHRLDAVQVAVGDAHRAAEEAGGAGLKAWVGIIVAAITAAGAALVTWLGGEQQ